MILIFLKIYFRWRAIAERLMNSPLIIEREVSGQFLTRFLRGRIVFQINFLIFDRSPQTLRKNIVQSASSSVHAYPDIFIQQTVHILRACEMAALVAVEDQRNGSRKSQIHPTQNKTDFKRWGKFSTHDVPRMPIQNSNRTYPPSLETYVRDVDPHTWLACELFTPLNKYG